LHYPPSLEEGGQTALGPALLLCVTVAARVPGSKVSEYLCLQVLEPESVCMPVLKIGAQRLFRLWGTPSLSNIKIMITTVCSLNLRVTFLIAVQFYNVYKISPIKSFIVVFVSLLCR